MKQCTKCNQLKPLNDFDKHKLKKDGLRNECKRCSLDYQNAYRKSRHQSEEYKYYCKLRNIKYNYGLDKEQYELLISSGCMVCKSRDYLFIDHDHSCCPGVKTCGKCIRGILCRNCNHAEGHLKSDPELVLMLYKYLTKEK